MGEAFGAGKFGLSFELFPPKTEAGDAALYRNLEELMVFRPDFVTCTYGAGGSTQSKTLDICASVRKRFDVSTASHLTCVGASVDQLRDYLRDTIEHGIENIVALRGDPPAGQTKFEVAAGGLRWASDLVALIRKEFPQLGIAVAGYPETHGEAISPDEDLANIVRKVNAGGDVVVTQLFYDNDDYSSYVKKVRALGVTAPIVPGIMPVTNYAQIKRITTLCKAKLPARLIDALESAGDDEQKQFDAGVAFAAEQCRDLIARGIPGLHFYVLNKSPATMRVLEEVGLRRKWKQRLPREWLRQRRYRFTVAAIAVSLMGVDIDVVCDGASRTIA
ncbi:MAG: methylenetetrahydrofolate reductase [NAD(P)H] [Pirellulales bacterium]